MLLSAAPPPDSSLERRWGPISVVPQVLFQVSFLHVGDYRMSVTFTYCNHIA